jgi:tripartite-type tricarboxylate transporter receptor subunit TctC
VFDFVSNVASLARPVATNADVPPERVAALRAAFAATVKDADFLTEAKKLGMEISPMDGDELQKLVTSIVDAPPAVVEKVRAALK